MLRKRSVVVVVLAAILTLIACLEPEQAPRQAPTHQIPEKHYSEILDPEPLTASERDVLEEMGVELDKVSRVGSAALVAAPHSDRGEIDILRLRWAIDWYLSLPEEGRQNAWQLVKTHVLGNLYGG